MKIRRNKFTRFESGPNMTPLVDVVMVILIFLMLVGTFAKGDWFLQQSASLFNTASSKTTTPPADFVPDEPIVVRVNYKTDDQYLAQAERISTSDQKVLADGLTKMRQDLEAIGKPLDKMTVVIQPQANVLHRQYMEVYEAALQAGFTKVSFAVSQ